MSRIPEIRFRGRSSLVTLLAALIPLLGALAPGPAHCETADSDAKAVRIADQVIDALGGKRRWQALGGVAWTFESAVHDTLRPGRRHEWDKTTGWHRVQGKNRQGVAFCFIHKVGADQGRAWMDGVEMQGDTVSQLMHRAQSLWTNDTYWMLMPYKLRDPGVRLKYAGDTTVAGVKYDRIALSFDHVGETPGDRYWVYVNRANHRVERWDFILQDQQPPPETWTWEGWEKHDGLWFPTVHRNGSTTLYTRNVATVDKFPPATFTGP